MAILEEILVTVSVAILLSFLVAKLVSMAIGADSDSVVNLKSSVVAAAASSVTEETKLGHKLHVGGSEIEAGVEEFVEERTVNTAEYEFDAVRFQKLGQNSGEFESFSELREKMIKDRAIEKESEVEFDDVKFPLSAENSGEDTGKNFSELREKMIKERAREEESEFVESADRCGIVNLQSSEVAPPPTVMEEMKFGEKWSVGCSQMEAKVDELFEKHSTEVHKHDFEAESQVIRSPENFTAENLELFLEDDPKLHEKIVKESTRRDSELIGNDDVAADQIEEIDDDWEGIERSELEEDFAAAASFVGKYLAKDGKLAIAGSDVQMQLYGLHKIATEGQCNEPQPMALKISARVKWNAWQRQGNMSPEVAMEQYVSLLSDIVPGWIEDNHLSKTEKDILKSGKPTVLDPDSSTLLQGQPSLGKKREMDLKSGCKEVLTGSSNTAKMGH